MQFLPPPWKIKVIEPVKLILPGDRSRAIKKAGFNTFLLKSQDVYIDLLTDSGTSAMSDRQWAGIMTGDESYAGSVNFYHLAGNIKKIYGFNHVVPAHQGRGAEHLLARTLIKPGQHVLSNMYFTTSREHVEKMDGIWYDYIVKEAYEPSGNQPFKGNMDIARVEKHIKKEGSNKIAFIRVEANCNMAGGQPFSMDNLKRLSNLSKKYDIYLIMDATRAAENAYFIKMRERKWESKPLKEIFKTMMSYVDGITVSSKKDNLVNIGGFLATYDKKIFDAVRESVVIYEGLHTYGGLAGRDMEAMAVGMEEMMDEDYMRHRIDQVKWFGDLLLSKGVPIVTPIGSHAVYVDASRFMSHIPDSQYRAQALAAAIYEECGVRSMERGAVSAGKDFQGRERGSKLELIRLTIPRRVYTNDHLGYTAEGIASLYSKRKKIKGLKMIFEPKHLRFFQARFARI
jgi:tyrosine phenol-lyase